jgi:hypothetical protein
MLADPYLNAREKMRVALTSDRDVDRVSQRRRSGAVVRAARRQARIVARATRRRA